MIFFDFPTPPFRGNSSRQTLAWTDGGFRALWDSDAHRRQLATIIRKETDFCEGCDTPNGGKWLEGEGLEPRRAPWPR